MGGFAEPQEPHDFATITLAHGGRQIRCGENIGPSGKPEYLPSDGAACEVHVPSSVQPEAAAIPVATQFAGLRPEAG
jgi:hypothetical protein